ncbi:dihydrofolate reductase [Segetibacter sp. 3557_3]|uniref:dihydrofolate reductase n=1 Tax=Segetibacter sp. 3557_3 TaxID=2547429 RepID=UPI0010591759|nr:dihydrofolate reductase [Segetibacter sp. 3557_3]TDH27976.1 dihydrofolate reductase [Segetibacter sp. 3557_3]
MIISLLVAASTNNVIGHNNQLPWHLPNDMKFFKNTTWGMPVIMGRKTYESMKGEPLPGRSNIVITRQKNWKADGVAVTNNWKDAMMVVNETDSKEVFVIGGGEVFKEIFPQAKRIYITRVHAEIEGDVFFPEIDKKWELKNKRDCFADEKHAYDYSFETWERK